MTEEKLDAIADLYHDLVPNTDDSRCFYLEILTACHGSVPKAVAMINQTLDVKRTYEDTAEKRRRPENRKVQKSISHFINDGKNMLKRQKIDSSTKFSRSAIELHTKEAIETHVNYLTYHENFLPAVLAGSLLKYLLETTKNIAPDEFYLFGEKRTQNVRVKPFSSNQDVIDGNVRIYYNPNRKKPEVYNDDLKMAQILLEDFVNEKIAEYEPLPFQVKAPNWKGEVVLVNRYENKGSLQWHSDRMTSIGPQPIIASLTLGCSRPFKVRKCYPSDSQVYMLRPPHNSLIIMHAGFQEEYKHCVPAIPKKLALDSDPISDDVRLNLTYRYYLPKYIKNNPLCAKCNCSMELRRCFKDPAKRGQYIWQCSRSYTGKECDGLKMANFDNEHLIVEDKSQAVSTWIAADDKAAQNARNVEPLT